MPSPWPPAILTIPVLLTAGGVLLTLIYRDLAQRRLPNVWVGVYAALFLPYATASGMGWSQLQAHVITGLIALLIAAPLFAFRAMGGGDVKLWAALMLWAGPQGAVLAFVIATIGGGLLGVLGIVSHYVLKYRRRPRCAPIFRMLSSSRGVPYGVGLAIAGLQSLWATAL
ncbi:prepilin peptidase [Alcaligenaceae bacterium CGII-47]|nr:prepilin peptidase [Alcaligenaceae bacterium CGII-47]